MLAAILTAAVAPIAAAADDAKEGPALAHMVFFTLKDHSKESVETFIASCDKYLSNHEGELLLGRHDGRGLQRAGQRQGLGRLGRALVFENKAARTST